ncbi:hypothetical protein ABIE08_003313 [Kaistia defluvii]|uniref:Uncharacterized protein n=1 Tax=Kaistia defluvii TaxID=410841 RepID=A0ABV2R282_9HYPH
MGGNGKPVFALQAYIQNNDIGRSYSVSPIEFGSVVKSMYVQAQPRQAKHHFLAEILVVIDVIDEGRSRLSRHELTADHKDTASATF